MNILSKIFSKKSILDPVKNQLNNLLNKILYHYTGDIAYLLPDKIESYINDGYKGNIHVYSVVTAITQRCTGIPFKHLLNEKDVVNSDMLKLLDKPNQMQGRDEFIEALFGWLLVTGNAYIYMISPEAGLNMGKPAEMWLLPSHLTEILGGGVTQPIAGYRVAIGAGMSMPISADKVIHLKYWNPSTDNNGSQLYGQSPLAPGLLTIQASNSGYKALNKAYQNGAPAGILTGTNNTGLDFTPEQVEKMQSNWTKKYGGDSNYMKPIFMRNPMQWIKMGYSVVDMNIVELMKYTMQDVCNIYHVPPYLFSTDASTLDNYKEARKAIYTDAVIPLFDRICSKLNPDFPGKFVPGSSIGFDISVIPELNIDVQAMSEALNKAWWLTGNQKLEMMGLELSIDPIMDMVLYPSNLIPGEAMQSNQDNNDMTL